MNVARGRGLVDRCLWHCLGPSAVVARPAGDYWPPGWPFLLGQVMRVVGTSFESTAYCMATLSLLLPLMVAALVWSWELPWQTAWMAGVMVCCLTELQFSCSMPDVTLSYQLLTLAGLIALARVTAAPLAIGTTAAFCMLGVWLRGDGFILWLAGAAVLSGRALVWWGLGGMVVVLSQLAYNLSAFGRLIPGPRGAVPWLVYYPDLYTFQPLPDISRWVHQGLWNNAASVIVCLRLFAAAVLALTPLVLLLATAAGALLLWRKARGPRAATLFLLLSALVPSLLSPIIANSYRFMIATLPIFCALAAPALLAGLGKVRSVAARAVALAALSAYFLFWPWPWYWGLTAAPAGYRVPDYLQPDVVQRLGLHPDDVVMSSEPWQVSACLDVGSVMCPWNGSPAIYQSIALYHPHYLLGHAHDKTSDFIEQSHLAHLRARLLLQSENSTWIELRY